MVIELNAVSKLYGTYKALDNLTVSIRPGAIGLLGPNGAGKSTLIKLLLGLVQLTSGQARVLGCDVRRDSRRLRELVGYMPEDDCVIAGLSGVEAVAFAGELAGLPARTSLRRAHEILDYVGIQEERYRPVETYSTGMRQKMKLAQAVIHAPKMVFLDEPTSGLDPQSRARMIRLIRQLAERKGVTVVVSTHILQDVEACCDSALILGRGKLLVYDTIANLKRTQNPDVVVRFSGEAGPFLKALEGEGYSVEPLDEQEVRVKAADGTAPQKLFEAARSGGVGVRQILASRNSLEEIFLKAVTGERHADL